MLNAIISWSLNNRFAVLVGAMCFVLLGWVALRQLNIDAFPDTTPVQVQINTFAPGLSPEEVERQITFPVEQSISGLPGLKPLLMTGYASGVSGNTAGISLLRKPFAPADLARRVAEILAA